MSFEHHIFVSYAHIDNEALMEDQQGWVSSLERALEIRVGQLAGFKPKVWRDPKLQGNDVFADSLVDTVRSTAALVSVLSPRYVQSEWCTRELEEFWSACADTGGAAVGNRSRVFKVVKTPVPLDDQPEDIQGLLGYEFYKEDPSSGRVTEFDQAFGQQAQIDFWKKLDDLAHDVAELLELIGSGAAPPPTNGGKEIVYLAESSSDLREERDSIRRDLLQLGHQVLPARSLPLVAEELREAAGGALDQSRLSVHLVGSSYGIVPEGAGSSVVELQWDLAAEAGDDRQRLIWLPPDQSVEEPRQLEFIERLRQDPRLNRSSDLLETPLEDFQTFLHERLQPPEPKEEEAPSPDSGGDDGPAMIYLICDQQDEEAASGLSDLLYDQGFDVVLPVFEGEAAEVRADHEENLCACDAVLIYYGKGSELWLRRKLRELHKIAGYGRKREMVAKGIYVAPPDNSKKKRLRTRDAIVLPFLEEAAAEPLRPFLAKLEGSAEASG